MDKTPMINNLICSNLISAQFSSAIEKAFKNEHRITHIDKITRAYYVYNDLKNGIPITMIEDYRLYAFHKFILHYTALNPEDKKATKLFEKCNLWLSIITNPAIRLGSTNVKR